jgi:MYXO-CTERM domain-containing protein
VRAEVKLSADAAPWRDALIYETWVDGEPYRSPTQSLGLPGLYGGSYLGRAKELFYYDYDDPDLTGGTALTRGEHRVTNKATLAGTDVALATEEQTFTLDCEHGTTRDGGVSTALPFGSGSGCSVRGTKAGASPLLLVLAAFAMLVPRRRLL